MRLAVAMLTTTEAAAVAAVARQALGFAEEGDRR
jgi:hypothetical protein